MWLVDITLCHICAKELLDSNFNEAVTYKISNLLKIAPNFTYPQKSLFLKYNWNFLDQPLFPYKFYGWDMRGIYFLIFASCEPEPLSQHHWFLHTSFRTPLGGIFLKMTEIGPLA